MGLHLDLPSADGEVLFFAVSAAPSTDAAGDTGARALIGEHADMVCEVAVDDDAVLLDAPCSGTGVLSKRADLRWRRTQEQVERDLPVLQDALLDAAAALVRPGGRLVYATCSVERDENDARVEAFLALPEGLPPAEMKAALTQIGKMS